MALVPRQRTSCPKPGSAAPIQSVSEELARDRLLRDGRSRQVRIESLKQPRPGGGTDLLSPESAHLGLAKDVVAREHLVGAFPGQHDLNPGVAHQPREQMKRRGRGAEDRSLGVEDDLRKDAGDIPTADQHLVVITVEVLRHRPLVRRLVVLGVLESQRKRRELRALRTKSQRGDKRAVYPAGQVAAHRYVRAQHAQAGGGLERAADVVDCVIQRSGEAGLIRGGVGGGPAAASSHERSSSVGPRRSRLELLNAVEDSSRSHWSPKRKKLVESRHIEAPWQARFAREYRFHLAGEPQLTPVFGEVEGTDAEGVSRENERRVG